MRFSGIRIHKIGPFRDVNINISAIPGKLVAITGGNGEGKSTFLELLPGALNRTCATRGSLTDLATGRDSFLEVDVVNGNPYTLRQLADGVSKKSEGSVLQNGVSLVASAKVREVDAWVASHFPAPEVLYASSFLSQGSEGFLDLSAAERKRVLLRLLQIEKYEAMAEAAREHVREAKAAWQTACAQLEDARNRFPALDTAAVALAEAQAQLETRQAELHSAQHALREADLMGAAVERALARKRERAALLLQLEQDTAALADKQGRLINNHMLLTRSAEIEAAVAGAERLQARDRELHKQLTARIMEHAQAGAAAETAVGARERAKRAVEETEARLTACEARIADGERIERAVRDLDKHKELVGTAQAKCDELAAEAVRLVESCNDQTDNRIQLLRGGLYRIADGTKPAAAVAKATLGADDAIADAPAAAREACKVLDKKITAAGVTRDRARERYVTTRELAARSKELAAARRQLDTARAQVAEAQKELALAAASVTATRAAAKRTQAAVDRDVQARGKLQTELNGLQSLCVLAPKLAQASARVEELQPDIATLQANIARGQERLEALPELATPTVDRAAAERKLEAAEAAVVNTQRLVTLATDAVERAQRGQAELAEREKTVNARASDMVDWVRLAADLGKDGLQAMEIDAALPELTLLTNDLLHSCHGGRFTVELRTDRLSADGTKTLEDLEVRVLDTVKGRDARGETYSGGERVIIGEALSLALTMLACRRAGLQRPTLVRDETGAALDAVNGRAYIAMLRRAAELLDADKVLFVTHTLELQELADARIVVAGGTATVQ